LSVQSRSVNSQPQEPLSVPSLCDKKGLNHSRERLSNGLLRYKDSKNRSGKLNDSKRALSRSSKEVKARVASPRLLKRGLAVFSLKEISWLGRWVYPR
jgi:hypothetical protein